MSKRVICRENVSDSGMRTGRSCGRFRRSEREVLREFHTPWKRMCIVFPTLSTESSVDCVDGPVQDVETMFALALALTLAAPGPRLDPQHLPRLPATGFARQLDHAVAPETLAVASPRLNPVGADTLAQAPEAVPLGWLAGMPVIHLRRAACGSGAETPGIYLFRGDRAARLLLRVPRFATYAMWGG